MKTEHTLIDQIRDARERTMSLIADLDSEQMIGPKLPTVNPLLWEVGHAAYFFEYWVLREHLGQPPAREDVDRLYDSIGIAHEDRWDLPLPELDEMLTYVRGVEDRVRSALGQGEDARRDYLVQFGVFHQDMHNEAYSYTRQTLEYPAPTWGGGTEAFSGERGMGGDVAIPGGTFRLGAEPDSGFVFDNEKWAHEREVRPFAIARCAVRYDEYLEFVEAGGYRERRFWDEAGWDWRAREELEHPRFWSKQRGEWLHRCFHEWRPLPHDAAMVHVSWHEAQAYCRWAGRRLPTELEWEVAAAGEPRADGRALGPRKRRYPWGDREPDAELGNLDGRANGTIDAAALPASDSAFGCRQMLGNVWEWTQDTFGPYPGFVPDMYEDYSQPLFGITKVLRGGSWATTARMIRNTWRTYYGPERNDVFAGFRTCALDG